ncbi:MAG: S8 family serine peptidase, partial [Gammaproteobacteria bacterium]
MTAPPTVDPPPPAMTVTVQPPPAMTMAPLPAINPRYPQVVSPAALTARIAPSAAKLSAADDAGYGARKTDFENTPEYTAQACGIFCITITTDQRLPLIKAAAAYARGATGEGEIVAVTDTGILATHREFAVLDEDGDPVLDRDGNPTNKVEISTQADECEIDPDTMMEVCTPYEPSGSAFNHGTSVASLVAGVRDEKEVKNNMHGVAFGASLRFHQIKLGSGGGAYNPLDISRRSPEIDKAHAAFLNLDYAKDAGAAVVNQSFGVAGIIDRYEPEEIKKRFAHTAAALAQAGVDPADKVIVVWAAGNAHGRAYAERVRGGRGRVNATSVEVWPGLGVHFPELRGHVLAVVALDIRFGAIASFSNRCGIAKAFCLAAPGLGLASANGNAEGAVDKYRSFGGTSAAAPVVSGSLALLRQYFGRQLGNSELVTRLLATANRTGIYADAEIYGHGLVDLDAATAPVGVMMTSLPGDPAARAFRGGGFAQSGGAFGAAMQNSLAGVKIAAFDQLGAPFFFPVSDNIAQAPRA